MSDLNSTDRVDSSATETSQDKPQKQYVGQILVSVVILLPALGYLGKEVWSRAEAQKQLEEAHCLNPLSESGTGASVQSPYGANAGLNGFDLQDAKIPVAEVLRGGPPKDGIPAISDPKFVAVEEADYMSPQDAVMGIEFGKEARAYPLRLLDFSEAVNDTVGGIPVAVTYCPLCASAAVFDRRVGDEVLEFGISGLLYNSNVLLYDRQQSQPESLWSQIMGQSISGSKTPRTLKMLPVEVTTWPDWKSRHPQGQVLVTSKSESESPYKRYYGDPQRIQFPVNQRDSRLPVKELVLGIKTKNATRAYPLSRFQHLTSATEFQDVIDGLNVTFVYQPQSRSLRVTKFDEGVEWMYAYWFAWFAFYPETDIYTADTSLGGDAG